MLTQLRACSLLEVSNSFKAIRGRDQQLSVAELWRFVLGLKIEPRRGWLEVSGMGKVESVADHSFGVAILALFEAERRGYDVGRTVRLALIHDLEEAITGDLTPGKKRELTAKRVLSRREAARSEIVMMFPFRRRSEYLEMWRDLTVGRTREARLVKDLDKLEMALQAKYYEVAGVERKELEKFYRSALRGISDASLRKVAGDVARSKIRRR